MRLPIRYERVDDGQWRLLEDYVYYSDRYDKRVVLAAGMLSDGATGAFDIHSTAWWVHDHICDTGAWADGTPVTAWQAATVLSDILKAEGRRFRSWYWLWATFLFGCHKTRGNGWW